MITAYINGNSCNPKIIDEMINKFSQISDFQLLKLEKDKSINYKDIEESTYPTIFCITPLSYDQEYIANIMKVAVEYPHKIIVIVIKAEYNEHNELITYTKAQTEAMEMVKLAFIYEHESYFNSIYSAYQFILNT